MGMDSHFIWSLMVDTHGSRELFEEIVIKIRPLESDDLNTAHIEEFPQ